MTPINVLKPREFLFLQLLTAWLPALTFPPVDEDGDDELTPEEVRHFEELEQQEPRFNAWFWNHGQDKNYGRLHLRWTDDSELDSELDIALDKQAFHRFLRFLCDEQARRRRDLEHDC